MQLSSGCAMFSWCLTSVAGSIRAMLDAVISHPQLQGLTRFSLASSSARGLYAAFGFSVPQHPSRLMEKFDPDVYRSTHTYEPIT